MELGTTKGGRGDLRKTAQELLSDRNSWWEDRLSDARLLRELARAWAVLARGAAPPSPSFPSRADRIEIAWNIHIACNFDCSYCFWHGQWDVHAPNNRYLAPSEWARHWKRFNDLHGPASIDIAGGEPFVYPGFLDILSNLCARNEVQVVTNLSWAPENFLARIPARSVSLYASFHPEYSRPELFIDKVSRLKAAGFKVTVAMVAYPPRLHEAPARAAEFKAAGIRFLVHPFSGRHAGRDYPAGYTAAAKAYLSWSIASGGHGDWGPMVKKYQLEQSSPRGLLCNSGKTFARLQADGEVTRCSAGGRIGNFFDEDFRLWTAAQPCPFKRCFCVNEACHLEGAPRGPKENQEAEPTLTDRWRT